MAPHPFHSLSSRAQSRTVLYRWMVGVTLFRTPTPGTDRHTEGSMTAKFSIICPDWMERWGRNGTSCCHRRRRHWAKTMESPKRVVPKKRGEVKYGHLLQISNLRIGNRHTQCAELNSWAGSSDSELEFWAQKVFGSGLKITLTHIVRPEEQTPNKLNTRPSWMDNK